MFRFDCPGCGKRFKLQDDNDGKKGKCSACGTLFTIKKPEPFTEKTLCPKCHTPIEKGSVICIECGYNFRTGKKLVEKVKEAKPTADETFEEVSQLSKGDGIPLNIIGSALAGIVVLAIVLFFSLRSPSEDKKIKKPGPPAQSKAYVELVDKEEPETESPDSEKPVEEIKIADLPQQVASPSEIYPGRHWDVFYYLAPDRPRDIVIRQTDEGHGKKYFEANVEVMKKYPENKIVETFGRPDSISEDFTKTFYFNPKKSEPKTELSETDDKLTAEASVESAQEIITQGSLWIYGSLQIMMQNKTAAYMWITGEEEIESSTDEGVLSKLYQIAQFTSRVNISRDFPLTIINKTPLDIAVEFGKDPVDKTNVQPQGNFPIRVVQPSSGPIYTPPKTKRVISPDRIVYLQFRHEQDFSGTVSFDDQDVSVNKSVFFLEPEAWIFSLKDSKRSPCPELIWTRVSGDDIKTAMNLTTPPYTANPQIIDLGDGPIGEFQTIETPSGVMSVKFSPDGGKIFSGNRDGLMYLWDIKTGQKILEYVGHSEAVTCIAFSPDEKMIVTGSEDNTICLWDIGFGKPITSAKGHSGAIRCLSWSEYSDLLISGGDDRSIRLWSTEDGQLSEINFEFNNPLQNPGGVIGLKFKRYGYLLEAVSSQQAPSENPWLISRIYKLNGMPISSEKKEIESIAKCMVFSDKGKSFLVGLGKARGGAFFSNLDSEQPKDSVFLGDEAKGIINGVALSRDNKYALSGGSEGRVGFWDSNSGIPFASYNGHQGEVTAVDFSRNGKFAVSGGLDKTIRIYRLPEEQAGYEYAINSSNLDVQAGIIKYLSKINNSSSRVLLIKALEDENYLVQRFAAEALGEMGHNSAVKPLIKLIGGEEATKLNFEYFTFGRPNQSNASGQKIELPEENLAASANNAKYQAMEALSKIGGNNAIVILFYWLNDKDLGYMAMEALKQTKDSSAVSMLTQLSRTDPVAAASIMCNIDQDNAKRSSIRIIKNILSTGKTKDKLKTIPMLKTIKSEAALLELLKATKVRSLRKEAESALSDLEMKNEIVFINYINSLYDSLENKDSVTARRIAVKLLQNVEDPDAIVPLIKTLSDESALISGLAATALEQMVNPDALEKMIGLLSDNDNEIQAGALSTLQKISGQQFGADPALWQEWWEQNQEDFAKRYEEKTQEE